MTDILLYHDILQFCYCKKNVYSTIKKHQLSCKQDYNATMDADHVESIYHSALESRRLHNVCVLNYPMILI